MSEEQLPWRDELDTLLGRLVDEDLSETETARLNEILRTQPEAKAQYHAYLDVHEDLETQFAVPDFGALDAVTKIVEPPQPSYTRPLLAKKTGGDWILHQRLCSTARGAGNRGAGTC